MEVPGRKSTLGLDAPQSPSPPEMPGGAVALKHWGSMCLATLLLGRRIPLNPPVYVGCGFDDFFYQGHKGIDLYKTSGDAYAERRCAFIGTPVSGANVYPAFPGCSHQVVPTAAKVVYAGWDCAECGNTIILEHTDNTHEIWVRTVYMHLATMLVGVGDWVTPSVPIGTVGQTGTDNPHLHFEINEQRATNSGWRTAAELALMPNTVYGNRPAIDPEKYLPPVAGSDLLHIVESPPPPAYTPPLPAVDLPSWRPHPQFPADLPTGYVKGTGYHLWGSGYGGPPWDATLVKLPCGCAMSIYPFLDAPDGKIYVISTGLWLGVDPCIWLLHSGSDYEWMITTFYSFSLFSNDTTVTLDVAAGQWITPGTRIARITTVGRDYPHMVWTVFARQAPWTATNPPFDLAEADPYWTYADDSVQPACFLADPSDGDESYEWLNPWAPACS